MTQPSAKTEFSNDQFGKLLADLYSTGHNAKFETKDGRTKLTIHGDLNHDVKGFDIDLDVHGDVLSNIDISGDLKTKHVKTSGGKTVNVNNLIMDTLSNIEGDGLVNVRGNIFGNMYSVNGLGNGLTLTCGGNLECSKIGNNVKATISGALTVGMSGISANGSETHVTANYIKAEKISGNKAHVFSATDIDVTYSISGGAKAFALGKIKAGSVGCPVGRGERTEGRTLVYSDLLEMPVMPYNAEIFANLGSPDLSNPYETEGNHPWPQEPVASITHYNAHEASETMIDFIRLGYQLVKSPMPKSVSREIHKRFAPA